MQFWKLGCFCVKNDFITQTYKSEGRSQLLQKNFGAETSGTRTWQNDWLAKKLIQEDRSLELEASMSDVAARESNRR